MGVLNVFAGVVQVGTYEQLDADLTTLLKERSRIGLDTEFKNVREAHTYSDRLEAVDRLKSLIGSEGFDFSHSFSAVLFSRILKPNSDSNSDSQLLEYLTKWHELERSVDFELPLNIAAVVIAASTNSDPEDIFRESCSIQSVMWPRGSDVRQEALPFYHPLQPRKQRTERLLVAKFCQDTTNQINYSGSGWIDQLYAALEEFLRVDLIINREDAKDISEVITKINLKPVDVGYCLLHPVVTAIGRELGNIRLRVELRELLH